MNWINIIVVLFLCERFIIICLEIYFSTILMLKHAKCIILHHRIISFGMRRGQSVVSYTGSHKEICRKLSSSWKTIEICKIWNRVRFGAKNGTGSGTGNGVVIGTGNGTETHGRCSWSTILLKLPLHLVPTRDVLVDCLHSCLLCSLE